VFEIGDFVRWSEIGNFGIHRTIYGEVVAVEDRLGNKNFCKISVTGRSCEVFRKFESLEAISSFFEPDINELVNI